MAKESIKYTEDRGAKASAIRHTFLRTSAVTESTDQFLAIGFQSTEEEYNVAILSRTVSEDEVEDFKLTVTVKRCHDQAIT